MRRLKLAPPFWLRGFDVAARTRVKDRSLQATRFCSVYRLARITCRVITYRWSLSVWYKLERNKRDWNRRDEAAANSRLSRNSSLKRASEMAQCEILYVYDVSRASWRISTQIYVSIRVLRMDIALDRKYMYFETKRWKRGSEKEKK